MRLISFVALGVFFLLGAPARSAIAGGCGPQVESKADNRSHVDDISDSVLSEFLGTEYGVVLTDRQMARLGPRLRMALVSKSLLDFRGDPLLIRFVFTNRLSWDLALTEASQLGLVIHSFRFMRRRRSLEVGVIVATGTVEQVLRLVQSPVALAMTSAGDSFREAEALAPPRTWIGALWARWSNAVTDALIRSTVGGSDSER